MSTRLATIFIFLGMTLIILLGTAILIKGTWIGFILYLDILALILILIFTFAGG